MARLDIEGLRSRIKAIKKDLKETSLAEEACELPSAQNGEVVQGGWHPARQAVCIGLIVTLRIAKFYIPARLALSLGTAKRGTAKREGGNHRGGPPQLSAPKS
jgi:hypothetical protein